MVSAQRVKSESFSTAMTGYFVIHCRRGRGLPSEVAARGCCAVVAGAFTFLQARHSSQTLPLLKTLKVLLRQ
jgi:hypothetical protein